MKDYAVRTRNGKYRLPYRTVHCAQGMVNTGYFIGQCMAHQVMVNTGYCVGLCNSFKY